MKRIQVALFLGTVLLTALTMPRGTSASSALHRTADLNIAGIRLGMTRDQVRPLLSAARYDTGVAYDSHRRVAFVHGLELEDGPRELAISHQSYSEMTAELGTPFLSETSPLTRRTKINFYRYGSRWVIMRYTTPSVDSRSQAEGDFGLTNDASTVPGAEWGQNVLTRLMATR